MGNKKAPHHKGPHDKRSRQLRATAPPDYRCPYCGLTRQEGIEQYGPTRGQWDADHIGTPTPTSPLQLAHATCNRSDGARRGNQRRTTGYNRP